MNGSRALPALLLVLALGVVAMLWTRRPRIEPLGAPARTSEAGEVRPEPSAPSSGGTREPAASSPAPKSIETAVLPKLAAITVELVAGGRPARAGDVELRGKSESKGPLRSVDPVTGAATFAGLPPGAYVVWVSKLPPGWLPPRVFQRNAQPDFDAHTIKLAGEDRTLRVELEPAVHLFGFVRTPEGRPARNRIQFGESTLRVRCWRKSAAWSESVGQPMIDVVDGHYEADLYEGLWRFSLDGKPALDEQGNEQLCVTPAPVLRRLLPGSVTQVDFDFRAAGRSRVCGRIVDELGQPFADLHGGIGEKNRLEDPISGETLAPGWPDSGAGGAFRTGPDGRFECANLVPGHYMLSVEPEGFCPRGEPGGRTKFGERPPTRELDVAGEVTTIELAIRRAHPVHITGRVVVDDRWAAEHAQTGAELSLELVFGYGIDGVPEGRDRLSLVSRAHSFDAWLDASMKTPRLELELAGEKLVVPLALAPEVTPAPLTIRFPR